MGLNNFFSFCPTWKALQRQCLLLGVDCSLTLHLFILLHFTAKDLDKGLNLGKDLC